MGRSKSNNRRGRGRGRGQGQPASSSARSGPKTVTTTTTVQRWAQAKQGISFKTKVPAQEDFPSAKASWIEVTVAPKQVLKATCWGFRAKWTADYRRDALWVKIPIATTSTLGEALKGLPASRPIGLQAAKKTKADENSLRVALADVFPDTDASWLSDLTALIAEDFISLEVKCENTTERRQSSNIQREFGLHVGVAWQQYMDKCLYKPAFAWPPSELLHIQMQRIMLWVLRASKEQPEQWSIADPDAIDRLYSEFVGDDDSEGQLGYDGEQELPHDSPCVEFSRDGVALGYDPFRACFLGLL